MLSQEISDSSDDDDSNDIVEITPTRQRNGKRKRLCSRSRSITPPPALPAHHIQNAKRIVRYVLLLSHFFPRALIKNKTNIGSCITRPTSFTPSHRSRPGRHN